MSGFQFHKKLDYTGFLTENKNIAESYPDFVDLTKVGADRVYFSSGQPAVLFADIESFNDTGELKRIADIQHRAWNYRKVILLFAVSDTEIRIYNCYEKPVYYGSCNAVGKKLDDAQIYRFSDSENDLKSLDILSEVFSRSGIDNGVIWIKYPEIRKKIDLQHRVDNYLVKCLMETASVMSEQKLPKPIIHGLLLRSLFILFLEDKGAANEAGLYSRIKPGCSSYFDILNDKEATYRLFEDINTHFNGNITPILPKEKELVTEEHLQLVRRCFMDGNISGNKTLFPDWRLFNFEIIQIELLSEIYENFLGEFKHEKGQFYTPFNLVDLILTEKLPTNSSIYDIKILDPACGSGIFLVESYKRLIKRWKNAHGTDKISFEDLSDLLLNNIFGIEIDMTAIKVAAFSLYLALIDQLDTKTLWIDDRYRLPYLISDPKNPEIKKQGSNLMRKDTIGEVNPEDLPEIDLLVGNPPFGKGKLPDSVKKYCQRHKFSKEYVLPFIHKSTLFCPNGEIALIFNTKVMTNIEKPYQNFRKWLFNDNYVEKVYNLSVFRKVPKNFGGQLFSSAVGPVSIIYFRHILPEEQSPVITYWAPKTFIKSGITSSVIIDNSDVKELPREECIKPDSKIWKIAHWGNENDFKLLRKLTRNTLEDYFTHSGHWRSTRGLNADREHPDFIPSKIIKTECIDRYHTDIETSVVYNSKYYRKKDKTLITPPFIIFKEGQHDTEIAASLFEEEYYCTSAAFIINSHKASLDEKKFLIAYLNSDIAKYYLFLTATSWGIERDTVRLKEVMALPSPFNNADKHTIQRITSLFDDIVTQKKKACPDIIEINKKERKIFEEFTNIFSLNKRDISQIEDTLRFSLGMLKDGVKSIGFQHTSTTDLKLYADALCKSLNTFFVVSKLKVTSTVYDTKYPDPTDMVVIQFGNQSDVLYDDEISVVNRPDELKKRLKIIHKYNIGRKSEGVYVTRVIRYYEGDRIYIIKPSQKRFWTQSQAYEDAASLLAEIISMNESEL